jgi:PilZ domain-containing protein
MVAIPEGNDRGKRLYCEVLGTTLELQAQDLSQAGVFVPMPDPFELDREVDVLLRSPIGELNARCCVVQVISRERARSEGRNAGCGMLFVDLADDQRAWIGLTLAALVTPPPAAPATVPAKPARAAIETVPSRPPGPRSIPATRSVVRSIEPPVARRVARTGGCGDRPDTVEQLERELAALQQKTPAAILGVPEGADPAAIHRAFLDMSKRYHPHAYAQYDDPKLSRLATELFIAHKRAFAQLCPRPEPKPRAPSVPPPAAATTSAAPPAANAPASMRPRKSAQFAPEHGTGTAPRPPDATTPRERTQTTPAAVPAKRKRVADAEMAFAAGLKHLTANSFADAEAELIRARELAPERPEAELWLRICRARKLKADGQHEAASAAYQAVLEIEADNREALEGANIERRKRPRLIQRLFGSGDD